MRWTFALPLLLTAAPAVAREDVQSWTQLSVQGKPEGTLRWFADAQLRTDDHGNPVHIQGRAAVGTPLNDRLIVYQGYSFVTQPVKGRRDIDEHRSFQQLNWTLDGSGRARLSARTRLEERWRSDGDGMQLRLRQQARYVHALGGGGLSAVGTVEALFVLNRTDWQPRTGLDQFRTFAGLSVPVSPRVTVEGGYLNRRTNRPGGVINTTHFLLLSVAFAASRPDVVAER